MNISHELKRGIFISTQAVHVLISLLAFHCWINAFAYLMTATSFSCYAIHQHQEDSYAYITLDTMNAVTRNLNEKMGQIRFTHTEHIHLYDSYAIFMWFYIFWHCHQTNQTWLRKSRFSQTIVWASTICANIQCDIFIAFNFLFRDHFQCTILQRRINNSR